MSTSRDWYRIVAAKKGDKRVASIDIYESIDPYYGASAKRFRRDLAGLGDLDEIELHLNSPGGAVFEGFAIYNTLLDHESRVIVRVDGMAASIASVIAMAGDEVHMASNAFLMIHNPWSVAVGDSEDMRRQADLLDSISRQLVAAYQRHSDLEADEIQALMDAETWMDAEEALEKGFATVVDPAMEIAASFDLSAFDRVPDGVLVWAGATEDERTDKKFPPRGTTLQTTKKDLERRANNMAETTKPSPAPNPATDDHPEGQMLLNEARQANAEAKEARDEARQIREEARRERAELAVDRDLLALEDVPPAALTAERRELLVQSKVEGNDAQYAVVLDLIKAQARPGVLSGPSADADSTGDEPLPADSRPSEIRALHRRRGLSDERYNELAEKYGWNVN